MVDSRQTRRYPHAYCLLSGLSCALHVQICGRVQACMDIGSGPGSCPLPICASRPPLVAPDVDMLGDNDTVGDLVVAQRPLPLSTTRTPIAIRRPPDPSSLPPRLRSSPPRPSPPPCLGPRDPFTPVGNLHRGFGLDLTIQAGAVSSRSPPPLPLAFQASLNYKPCCICGIMNSHLILSASKS